jgi:hypothetical protein
MMVYLDVVYNHFGPHLNYLHDYAQSFFTARRKTGWGRPLISKAVSRIPCARQIGGPNRPADTYYRHDRKKQ